MTKSQMKFVAESYAKYFGRAADADTIKEYGLNENDKAEKESVILENIIADADVEKGQIDPANFVNNAFQNLFGRNATTKEMSKYYKVVDAGKDLPINSIVKSAAKTDKAVYNNKMAVAVKYAELGGTEPLDLSKISKGNTVDLNFLNTVTKAADLKAKIETLADNSGIPSSFDGKTFVLTTGVDAGKDFIGTNKNDLFIADNSVTVKTSAADTLDGGKGVDTFKVYDDASTPATSTTIKAGLLPTLKNIENVVIYDNASTAVGAIDLKQWDSVETLFLVRDTSTGGYNLGKKVTTVNFEDISTANQIVTFDKDLTAATLGVNNVITNVPGAVTVKVDGTALKTLTVNAYGKASTVALVNNAIETLNITGKANLTLDATSTLTAVKTIDGSKAEGNLTLTNTANMTSIKTGSGNDTVNVAVAVDSGETINLGAGNDKLVAGAGTIAAGSIIDGGAGIDSLDAALVTSGNAGVFASFETLSLTTAADLDLALVNKSTFTTIAIDGNSAGSTVRNVSTSQSLTVNAAATSTILSFKDAAGTANAYKINFNADNAANTNAGTVVVDKIETVTVNSVGKTGVTNTITLTDDAAKSLVITGDKDLTVNFATGFGKASANATDGLGVSTIDASAATGAVNINTVAVNVAFNGITIKGGAGKDKIDMTTLTTPTALSGDKIIVNAGAGDDTITVNAKGGILTGGAGKDTFNVTTTTVGTNTTEAAGVVKVTITDLTVGDKIIFADNAAASVNEIFNKTQLDVSAATNLDAALTTAFAGDGSTNEIINWFQYAGNTYIVENVTDSAIDAGDIVVKINGLVDLKNSTFDTATDTLTIA